MEVSDVRRRLQEVIEQSKRAAAERRVRVQEAEEAYGTFLNGVAIPVLRQLANVLKVEGYPFTVATPAGSVRLSSDRTAQNFLELTLDTEGQTPVVQCHVSYERGRRVQSHERPVCEGTPIAEIGDEALLEFLLPEIARFVAR
ncbi:MAG: hypothetical protein KGN76_08255 [Acidobacteriota bacterium]|nr:hypothetical protein [Acidobacteriota bacterium]